MINLTIIVPHYNSSEKLEKLLSTIPDMSDIQVIIVDDNSNSVEFHRLMLLKQYNNFELYKNLKSKGAGACRNIGIEKAIGYWILFADTDDFFESDFYNKVSKFFNDAMDVVFFHATSIYIDTNTVSDRHVALTTKLAQYLKDNNLKNELELRYKLAPAWSKLIRKDFINTNNIKFDEVFASNDVMFSMKVGLYMKNFLVSEDILYVVTRNHGSLTVTFNKKVLESRVKVFISQYLFLKIHISSYELKLLGFSSLGFVFKVFIDYGCSTACKVLRVFMKAKVPVFNRYHINPIFLYGKIKGNIISTKRNFNYKTNN